MLFLATASRSQNATISEQTQVFRTYPFSDPDPVARMGNIYPYFRFQGYSIHPINRPWKIVTLENPYIRVLVAPEVGGKVLGAFEKSTGRAFIYYNHAMKFREIAMRGPWTSGGIEFNFGDIGHAPTTASPVDYLTRRNADGSVSCIVGALDLPSRTEWRVEVRLPRDRAAFETRSFWFNPTDLSTSLYHWTNAAVDADSTLQVLYPGRNYIGHGGEPSAWPIDSQGRDLSYYRNNAFGSYKSYHVLGSYTDYFGARWGDFGMIHWSPYTEKPGKKLWIWGLSREGEIWKDLLADPPNTQYVEIQSGLHFNQAVSQSSRTPFKHMTFLPHSAESFTEIWYPFKGLEGVTRATPEGALQVRQIARGVEVAYCPTGAFRGPVSVTANGRTHMSRLVALRPLEMFKDTLALPAGEFEVRIGVNLRYHSGEDRVLQRPIEEERPMDWTSAHGREVEARELARQRDYDGALASYRASIALEPTYLPSLTGAAELFYRRMEYDSALILARRALAIDTYDPEANFIYGLAQKTRGATFDARDAFGIATQSRTYAPAAFVQLAELAYADSDLAGAASFARKALKHDASSVAAHRLLAVLYRRAGDHKAARAIRQSMMITDPLSHFTRCESYFESRSAEARKALVTGIRSELPYETYLELAAYYLRLGLPGEAGEILTLSPRQMMVDLWAARAAWLTGDRTQSSVLLERALAGSPGLVFPHRQEDLPILRWALAHREHWKTRYLLALLLWHYGRTQEAGALLESCGEKPEFAPFYLARASFFRADAQRSLQDLRRARRLAPEEWRTYSLLATTLNEQGNHAEALRVCREASARFPESYVITFLLARTLVMAGEPATARSILDTLTILPFEGSRIGRDIYRQAHILEAVASMRDGKRQAALDRLRSARLWPERLGAGQPYDPDARLEDFLEARLLRAQGDSTRARQLLAAIVTYTREHRPAGSPHQLIAALASRELGDPAAGEAMLTDWAKHDPANSMASWSLLAYRKQRDEKAEQKLRNTILNPSTGDPECTLLVEVVHMLNL